jgi:hypothetical protein
MSAGDRLPLSAVRIKSVPLGDVLTVRFLGPIRPLPTHHVGKRTVACEGEKSCPHAAHQIRPIWKWYGPVEWWVARPQVWRPAILEVTEHLEEVLHGRELRGEIWGLTREGESSRKSACTGTYYQTLPEDQLSQPFDVEPILQRFFRVQKLLLDMPCPIPSRVFLSDVRGPAPEIPEDIRPASRQSKAEDREKVKAVLAKMMDRARMPGSANLPTDQAGDESTRNGQGVPK